MEFSLISSTKLKVSLDARDLSLLGLSYESLDYSDPPTKRLLISLLEQGKEVTGFRPSKTRLFIEVFPNEDNGCTLFYTCLQPGQNPPGCEESSGPPAVIFSFETADALIEAATKTFSGFRHRILKSSLYHIRKKGYRLAIYPLDYNDNLSVTFLGEYAEKAGEGDILLAFLEEHGSLLIQDTALDTLAEYFG